MNDSLDELLKKWADGHKADDVQLRELSRRITTGAAFRRPPAPSTASAAFGKLLYASLGAAAVLVVLLGMKVLQFRQVPAAGDSGSSLAAISAEDLSAVRKLYGETERLFADQLRWIAQSNGDIGMGVEPIAGGAGEGAQPVLARIVVVARKSGDKEWTRVWKTDVLLRGDELAEVKPNPGTDNRVALWVHPVSTDAVAVDTRLELRSPVIVSATTTLVVSGGHAAPLMSWVSDGTEYRVYQAVSPLAEDGGA